MVEPRLSPFPTARMSNERSKQILKKSHTHLTLELIISNKNGLSRSKYHIWDAQHDTSNLAASKAELTWMRLDLISLILSLDLVTDTRLQTDAMRFFVGAFCRVAKRGMDIYL